jgi:hypothetical protein
MKREIVTLQDQIDLGIKQLDELHYHEMIDRLHCVDSMIEELLVNHPCAVLVPKHLEKVQK